MANRYLRATGNWNGSVWADTSGGTAGSAATPTASDDVYIAANYTVTLTADANCANFSHTNGTLDLDHFKLSVNGYNFSSTGTTSRTLNLNTGTLEVTNTLDYANLTFGLSGSNLNFLGGASTVILNVDGFDISDFHTLSKSFNDVRINMGAQNFAGSKLLNITGSPTFRTLDIRIANNDSHTVNFGDSNFGSVVLEKLVAIGKSTGRLTLQANQWNDGNDPGLTDMYFNQYGSSYGQYVDVKAVYGHDGNGTAPLYIGSNSTDDTFTWLIQDPQKMSTLVDPLTTAPASNSNWNIRSGTFTTVTSGYDGGGYEFAPSGVLVSTDTFDAIDSEIVIELPSYVSAGLEEFTFGVGMENSYGFYGYESDITYGPIMGFSLLDGSISMWNMDSGGWAPSYPSGAQFIKIVTTSTDYTYYTSSNGISWSYLNSITIPNQDIYVPILRSSRVYIGNGDGFGGNVSVIVGSINPDTTPLSVSDVFLLFFNGL